VLNRVVRLINPVVDVLSRADPLGLKGRSHHLFGDDYASVDKVLDALAWVINTADLPGTEAWEDMDLDGRANWWVRRVGCPGHRAGRHSWRVRRGGRPPAHSGRPRLHQPGHRVVRRRA
jgi:hypothetical protein